MLLRAGWKRTLAVSLAGAAALLVLAEVFARVFLAGSFQPPSRIRAESFPFEYSHFGTKIVAPGTKSFSTSNVRMRVGHHVYPFNSLGYRGHEIPLEKAPGTVRMIFFGGSSVLDVTQGDYDDWPNQVGERLRRRGLNVEVLNAGLAGNTSYDAMIQLETGVQQLKPDFVFLYNTFNDISYFHFQRPLYFVPRPRLENPFTTYFGTVDRLLSEHLHVYALIRNYALLEYFHRLPQGKGFFAINSLDDGSGVGKLDGPSPVAMAQYELILKTFVDTARNIGAVPVLMHEQRSISDASSEGIRKTGAFYEEHFDYPALNRAFAEADRAIDAVSAEKRALSLDFREKFAGRPELFFDAVHLSRPGADLLSELIADSLYREVKQRAGRGR